MDDRLRLSKFMALLLRHKGHEFGLTFDAEGFVGLSDLLAAIVNSGSFSGVSAEDIRSIVASDPKGRYEIRAERIRARYGHSLPVELGHAEVDPPVRLFHGTTPQAVGPIMKFGLKPQGRQFIHLSVDEAAAFQVGRRRAFHPVILEIDAAGAASNGVKFFKATDAIYLAREVPPRFIKVLRR